MYIETTHVNCELFLIVSAATEEIECPKDIFVEVPPKVNVTKVTLPSDLWSHNWKVSPDWVKPGASFPAGVTKVTLSVGSAEGSMSCTFNVNVVGEFELLKYIISVLVLKQQGGVIFFLLYIG